VAAWRAWLETQGVMFSVELDLDMMMLRAFPAAYGLASGVDEPEAGADYRKAVFGEKGDIVPARACRPRACSNSRALEPGCRPRHSAF